MVKDLALSLQELWSLLWLGFNPWPGNVHILKIWANKYMRTHTHTHSWPFIATWPRRKGPNALVSDIQPPGLGENKRLSCKPLR